jgi:putative ABC transport system permease protein
LGTFTDSGLNAENSTVVINYDYLNEARAGVAPGFVSGKDKVNHFNVRIADPRSAATVSEAIDARFANSRNETRTESMRENAQENLQSIGNLQFLIRSVVAAVMAALLFATATMMMQSVRERTSEFAVLKTVGFTNGTVFALTLAESALVCVVAGGWWRRARRRDCGLSLRIKVRPWCFNAGDHHRHGTTLSSGGSTGKRRGSGDPRRAARDGRRVGGP